MECAGCEARAKGDYTKGHDHSAILGPPTYLDKLALRAREITEQEIAALSTAEARSS